MLDKLDLNQELDRKTYKRIMPLLTERLYAVQKASWDAQHPGDHPVRRLGCGRERHFDPKADQPAGPARL